MKLKKIISFLLAAILLFGITAVSVFAADEKFVFGVGPETDGYAIDYRYYSPVKEDDSTKYPLVIWLHGMGNGIKEGAQIDASDIAEWTTDDFQKRFKGSEGAFIFAPRSLEEKNLFWDEKLIYPLRAAIDDFIAKNSDNIDVTRIYLGGYSMGGKMTLKMAVAYPEMFAAVFPICPAWIPTKTATAKIADIPVWLTSGTTDPIVNYYSSVMTAWKNIVAENNNPELCRFSTLSLTRYADGKLAASGHHAWFAVNNDMFSSEKGDYPSMKTVNGNGETVKLDYPDGMISWLSGFTSNYDGSPAVDSGNAEAKENGESTNVFYLFINFIKNFFEYIFS